MTSSSRCIRLTLWGLLACLGLLMSAGAESAASDGAKHAARRARLQRAQARQRQARQRAQQRNTYSIRKDTGKSAAVSPSPRQAQHQHNAALKSLRATSRAQTRPPSTLQQRLQHYKAHKQSLGGQKLTQSQQKAFINAHRPGGGQPTLYGPRSAAKQRPSETSSKQLGRRIKHAATGPHKVRHEYKPDHTGPVKTVTTYKYGFFKVTVSEPR